MSRRLMPPARKQYAVLLVATAAEAQAPKIDCADMSHPVCGTMTAGKAKTCLLVTLYECCDTVL